MSDHILSDYERGILERLSLLIYKRFKFIEFFDKDEYRLYSNQDFLYFSVQDKKIIELEIEIDHQVNLRSIQEYLEELSSLRVLKIFINNSRDSIIDINLHIKSLKYLEVYVKGNVRLVVSIENLPNLLNLLIKGDNVGHKELLDIDGVKNAKNLYRFEIISIPIIRIPDYISHISSLEDLVLRDCGLKEFNRLLLEIDSLEWLDLRGNKELRIDKKIRDLLWEKLKLFNPPEHYSLFNDIETGG